MLLPNGSAVVTDFRLARSYDEDPEHDLSNKGDVAGNPAYMAPEQVEGANVGPPADVYAFGVVLYEMVTGKRPFVGESSMSVAVKRLKHDAPSPRTHLHGGNRQSCAASRGILLRASRRRAQPSRR
jgi:serine/threonine-protein kinase